MAHLSGLKLDCAMEYLNWYNSGWQGGFIAKQGYYSPVPETAKKFLTQADWDYWYEGKPAAVDITDPYRHPEDKKGAGARRRLPVGARGAHFRLEHGDGRRPLSDASLERVHLRLITCLGAQPARLARRL